MKWSGRRQSDNMEDRRGMSSGGKTIHCSLGTLLKYESR